MMTMVPFTATTYGIVTTSISHHPSIRKWFSTLLIIINTKASLRLERKQHLHHRPTTCYLLVPENNNALERKLTFPAK
jgi:hypothetical protein